VIADRFEIVALAGQGGMGAVYRANDLETAAQVALKVLVRNSAEDATARFLREARVLSELRHPHIVRYFAHGEVSEGEPYLAMEWLDGEDLASRKKRGALALGEAAALVAALASALDAAHSRGVIHRDVKPHNVFLVAGDPEQAKLLDFGLARWNEDRQKLTRTGVFIGSPAYMSPEQGRGDPFDHRTDIYSLGVTWFECLAGRLPFEAIGVAKMLGKLLFQEPPRVASLRGEVPPEIDELIARMLAKDPAARPDLPDVVRAAAQAFR
jgi:serine/threonine protein kinase